MLLRNHGRFVDRFLLQDYPRAAMANTTHITILGAGPAGLAAGAAARELDFDAVVLEANDRVGGNCRTFTSTGSASIPEHIGYTTETRRSPPGSPKLWARA